MHSRSRVSLVLLAWLVCAAPAFAESVTLFRVFLNDGTAIVSYGEYARVGDRIVFSMPIGEVDTNASADPSLHVVNLPVSAVNWTATEKYAASARHTHYMANGAKSDYAALAGDVAGTLNAIVLAKDAQARLKMAVDARRRLATWPRDHYGYRATDVAEMLGLLDEAISGLRLAAGETSFTIDLVASPLADTGDRVPMMRAPSAAEAISQAIAAAKATDIAVDRVSILRSVITVLDNPRNTLPAAWVRPTRQWAVHTIAEEARIEKTYAGFTASALERATAAAGRADVRAVERVMASAVRRDTQLGQKRREEINALLEQVRQQLDAARRLRLARDRWHERASSYRAYKKSIAPILNVMARAQRSLDDIKRLSGSDATVLVAVADRLAAHGKTLSVLAVPDELKPAHALLTSAVNLAETAVKTRRQAAASGELQLAWDASSAAAGSMMLLTKAQEDMEAAVRLPEIR
ncbi:MAG TPA: hypothetical protein VM115_11340 [Vicinamibacterales bacterium]|nr:hypothetical protein [Vicinamibacterales bacterium]